MPRAIRGRPSSLRAPVWVLILAVATPGTLTAQAGGGPDVGEARCGPPFRCQNPLRGGLAGAAARRAALDPRPRSPADDPPSAGRAFLLSAVLPGAAQYRNGQRRWMAYVAAEITGWLFWADRRGRAFDLQDRYRDVAWEEARRTVSGGMRVAGDFQYYETLTRWTRSGRFDIDPDAPGVQPETDPTTFNGSIWRLARDIFLPAGRETDRSDEGFRSALAYYEERAAGPDFLWDWTGKAESQERFRDLIEESDDEFREATIILGAVIGNHLLSAVDGFVSARLRDASGGRVDASARLVPELGPGIGTGTTLHLGLTVRSR